MLKWELNQFGKRVWKHANSKILFLELAYSHKDSVILLQEDGMNRQLIESIPVNDVNWENWIPMSQEEYDKVTRQYKEIYSGM